MTVDQLPGRVREFANYLNGLLARLDQGAGWCAVFWQRDPDGMRACLDGREVPPWDVVEALLQDLAAAHGPEAAAQEAARLRPLHAAALAAHDARPGGRDALGDRLDVMLREQRYAAERPPTWAGGSPPRPPTSRPTPSASTSPGPATTMNAPPPGAPSSAAGWRTWTASRQPRAPTPGRSPGRRPTPGTRRPVRPRATSPRPVTGGARRAGHEDAGAAAGARARCFRRRVPPLARPEADR